MKGNEFHEGLVHVWWRKYESMLWHWFERLMSENGNGLTLATKCLDLRFSMLGCFDAKFSTILQICLVDYVSMVFFYNLFYGRWLVRIKRSWCMK